MDCSAVADQSAGETQESGEVGSLAVVAAGQAPEPADPFQAALDDVAVPAEVSGGFDALTAIRAMTPRCLTSSRQDR